MIGAKGARNIRKVSFRFSNTESTFSPLTNSSLL